MRLGASEGFVAHQAYPADRNIAGLEVAVGLQVLEVCLKVGFEKQRCGRLCWIVLVPISEGESEPIACS